MEDIYREGIHRTRFQKELSLLTYRQRWTPRLLKEFPFWLTTL